MKHLPILAAIGLGIILLVQNRTTAGGNPPPRTVPVIVQDVIPPSKMVAVSFVSGANPVQLQVPLQRGQVLVVTSWSVNGQADGQARLAVGPSGTLGATKDSLFIVSNIREVQHVIPTGIRFPRDAGGLADVYVSADDAIGVTVSVQGYITDDF